MKKANTFLAQRSNPMDFPNYPRSTSLVLSKSPSIEYPSTVDPSRGEQMLLSCHSHPLAQTYLSDPFTCMGCKEYGAGTRFTCQHCNFQLHEFCALAPTTLKSHPFHCQHPLGFCSKPGHFLDLNQHVFIHSFNSIRFGLILIMITNLLYQQMKKGMINIYVGILISLQLKADF